MSGVISRGVRAPIIREGDDIVKLTADAVEAAMAEEGFELHERDIVAVTESVVARSDGNYASVDDIATDVKAKLGGGTVALGFACDLAGDRARIDLGCRYHAGGAEVLDINEVVRQHGRNTRSELAYNGVLEDAAKKSLRTTIDLVHGAKGAQGNEAETVLVLGDDVVNKTLPTILCDEDDVAGNHGATIGSVSPEQLAYLADRGLSREDAEQLFVRALYEEALMNAPCDEARAVVMKGDSPFSSLIDDEKGLSPFITEEA